MIKLRKSEDRGMADHGWLKSQHTFSFAEYFDRSHMGFKNLRVINEDKIAGGKGFGTHPHRDMEIISYVITGALEHQDSMGNKAVILPGEVQRMSAGTGITHSEYNKELTLETHFFQIWIIPQSTGTVPSYGQKSFEQELRNNELVLVISSDARNGSIGINQDADIYISRPKTNDQIKFKNKPGRGVWVQVIKGQLIINENHLNAGDALAEDQENELTITANADSEFLLFDLA